MKKIPKLWLCVFWLSMVSIMLPCFSLWAADLGILLDQNAGHGGSGSSGDFDYSGTIIPRFTAFLGNGGSLFVSAGLKAEYQNETWTIAPELLRTDLAWRFGSGEFRAGRMLYSDPLGYIAEGLFDGAGLSLDTAAGTISAGAWYTGLLYKKRAYIAMTDRETESYNSKLDYSDFTNSYFAPKRILSALGWEHPGLAELFRVKLSLLGQFDLERENSLHSQYLAGKITLPAGAFVFDLGGCLELAEADDDPEIAFTGELGIAWIPPASFESRLSLLGRYSSGMAEDSKLRSFLPLTTVTQGDILKAKLSGLSLISLDYLARLDEPLSLDIRSSYFIRSDWMSYTGLGNNADGYFLGNEFFGRLLWSPASDLQLSLGGGVFLPSLGDVAPKADPLWRVELGPVMSLY